MTELRILVVEDDAMIAMLMTEVLADLGHNVCGVETTQAGAISAAAYYKPDLMIVDARLAAGSGVAAVAEILRTGFVPHVFVSGDMLADKALGQDSVCLLKPFCEADLARAIERALSMPGASMSYSESPG